MSHAWDGNFDAVRLKHYSFSAWRLKATHYFIQDFDATNFSESNRNQTE